MKAVANRKAEKKQSNEAKVLKRFIAVYCRENHGKTRGELCRDCSDLLDYGLKRLYACPYDPKPKCKDCPTHCYQPEYRAKIREVMRFSGIYFVKRGRLDWLVRYFMM
jgi:hypothetical protein